MDVKIIESPKLFLDTNPRLFSTPMFTIGCTCQ
jgi:hypothetical protein